MVLATTTTERDKRRTKPERTHTRSGGSRIAKARPVPALLVMALGLVVLTGPLASAVSLFPPVPDQRLTGSETSAHDNFGKATAVDRDTALVGAPQDSRGAAYIFERTQNPLEQAQGNAWTETTILRPPSDSSGGTYGDSLALAENVAAVAAPLANDGDGLVTIHRQTPSGTWIHEETLHSSTTGESLNFGDGLAVLEHQLAVGVTGDDTTGENAGAVVLFEEDDGDWTRTAELHPQDGPRNAIMGATLDAHQDVIVAGAPLDDPNGDFSGSAYVFEESDGEWSQTAKLVAPDGERGDSFGDAVATNGDTIAIGAPFHGLLDRDDIDEDAGAVFTTTVHDGNVSDLNPLYNPRPEDNDQFGRSLALSENTLLVGTPGDEGLTENTGAAYAYTGTGNAWILQSRLGPEDPDEVGTLGTSLALDAGTAVVGSQFTNHALVYNDILPHTNDTNNDQGCVQASTGEGFTLHASTPTVHENLTIEQRNETVGEEDVFVPGVTVRVGDEEIEAGGEWVHVPGASVGTPGVEASVGPLAASQSASVEQPSVPVDASATGCVQHG